MEMPFTINGVTYRWSHFRHSRSRLKPNEDIVVIVGSKPPSVSVKRKKGREASTKPSSDLLFFYGKSGVGLASMLVFIHLGPPRGPRGIKISPGPRHSGTSGSRSSSSSDTTFGRGPRASWTKSRASAHLGPPRLRGIKI